MSSEPSSAGTPYPNIRQSILLALLALLLQILLSQLLYAFFASFEIKVDATILVGIVNLLVFSFLLWRSAKHRGSDLFSAYDLRGFDYLLILPVVLFVCGLAIGVSEIDNLTRLVFPVPKMLLAAMETIAPTKASIFASILSLCVVAPLTEELFFRGLLLKGIMGSHSKTKAILVSAALFALFHVNPYQFFGAFAAGIFFGWLYIRTGSVLPGIIGHAVINFIPILIVSNPKLDIPGFTGMQTAIEFQPLWFDIAGAALMAVSVFL